MRFVKIVIIFTFVFLIKYSVNAQTLPVGTTALEDYYRRAQLLGTADTNVSFTVRPVFPNMVKKGASIFYPDTTERGYSSHDTWQFANKKGKFVLLPLTLQTQDNTGYPTGWNDGAMIPARGVQTLMSAGFFVAYGPLTIQFKPEFVAAANTAFSTFNPGQFDVIFARYYDIYNNIDLPARFGINAYSKAFWGQSSIRFNYKSLSVGLSTENLWWGPGIQNSLLMSNTAPGFPHLTLNTTKPIKTAIGSFEGQLIGGRLTNSGFPPLEPDHYYFGTDLYVPKPNDWRYLAGIIVTWQPKWTPGLFLGFDQTSQTYGKDLSGFRDYLPLFSGIKQVGGPDNPINKQDQISSVFMRYLWVQEHAEIYFEYGQYDNTQDLLQELLAPNNSRAYTFGVRKLLSSNKSAGGNILISVEATQLQENSLSDDLAGKEWYLGQYVRQGYTNQGQELGAGIGPGGNLQTIDVAWVKGLKKIGFQFQRYAHNNDFYYYAFSDSFDDRRHWVDLSAAFTGEWNYKNLIFNAKIQGIKSFNYQWYLKDPELPGFTNGVSAYNVQIQAGVSYRF